MDHTAQEIDDAIARALPGGAIDTALQKKADEYDLPIASNLASDGGIKYCKDKSGIVHLYGNFCTERGESFSNGQALGTLPAGFRPTHTTPIPVSTSAINDADNGWNTCINIYTDGTISCGPSVPPKSSIRRAYIWVSGSFVAGN